MAAKLILAPEAEQDLAKAYAWYEDQRTGWGEDFLRRVDACLSATLRCTPSPEVTKVVFMDRTDHATVLKLGLVAVVGLAAWLARAQDAPVENGDSPPPRANLSRDGNLLPNGDFEMGDESPAAWQTIDGLSSFWVDDDPAHGKVMKFDTDVLQSQAYAWWEKIVAGAKASDAPLRLPTVEPKYDTLAGLDGVWFYSDYIAIEKNKAYWLTLDVKGPEILVWLVGYPEKPDTTFGADQKALRQYLQESKDKSEPQKRGHPVFISKYVWKGQMKAGGANQWKTYSRRAKPFEPTKNTPNVRYVRVMIYPYWPPGTYYVDNVKLVEYQPGAEAK